MLIRGLIFNVDHEADSDDAIVAQVLATQLDSNDFGPEVSENLLKSILNMLSKTPSKEEQEKAKESFKCPANAKQMMAPRVNLEIWQNLPKKAQASDVAQQHIQQMVARSLIAQTRLAECLVKNSKRIPQE